MKLAILASLAASAAAFTAQSSSKSTTALNAGMDDLKAIAEKSNPVLKVSLCFEWATAYEVSYVMKDGT